MSTCTFFGHRDCPSTIKPKLREVLVNLIEHCGVTEFYVGRQGTFDAQVRTVLRELSGEYSRIHYAVVLERLPDKQLCPAEEVYSDTMLPEGMELAPPRYAISWRNNWLLKQADYVVTYITHSWGGAAQFAAKAVRQKKTVINLADF